MPINKLSSGGMIANYKCPAACGHCMYGCSPDAQPENYDCSNSKLLLLFFFKCYTVLEGR